MRNESTEHYRYRRIFFKVVDSCEGKVELVTGEGDRLNLKSKLSQYVSMANIFSNGEIPELEIVAHEPEDIDKLVKFMLLGNGKRRLRRTVMFERVFPEGGTFFFVDRIRKGESYELCTSPRPYRVQPVGWLK